MHLLLSRAPLMSAYHRHINIVLDVSFEDDCQRTNWESALMYDMCIALVGTRFWSGTCMLRLFFAKMLRRLERGYIKYMHCVVRGANCDFGMYFVFGVQLWPRGLIEFSRCNCTSSPHTTALSIPTGVNRCARYNLNLLNVVIVQPVDHEKLFLW